MRVHVLLFILALASQSFASSGSGERFGRLRVDTDPPGADVVIIADLGKTPVANDFMNPGLYKIEILHPGGKYLPITEEVNITAGQAMTVNHTLKKPPFLTKRKGVQLILGTIAAAGAVWAAVDDDRERRTIAGAGAGVAAAAMAVTIVIW